MRKVYLSMIWLGIILSTAAFGQKAQTQSTTESALSHERQCHFDEKMQELRDEDPQAFDRKMKTMRMQVAEFMRNNENTRGGSIVIPVHVIVVYNNPSDNISDAQVQSQIDVLNEDFRRLNSDWTDTPSEFESVVADAMIEFCLATVDPDGNPTNGITRYNTTSTNISGVVKPATSWGPTNYLNMWCAPLGGGLLGYATFPGGSANQDGVVITTSAFGRFGSASSPFNLGRTGTHEVGHWFGLDHIWGGGCSADEGISDTPNSTGPYYGCPSYPQNSCSSSDMFMNYMDYVDDDCMVMFSNGQADHMNAVISTQRSSMLTAADAVCSGVAPTCLTPSGLTASAVTETSAELNWTENGANNYDVRVREVGTTSWTTVTVTSSPVDFTGGAGCKSYEFQVAANCTDESSSFSGSTTFLTSGCVGCEIPVCASTATTDEEWIESVTVGSYTNTSGSDNGYGDFTGSIALDLEVGSSYNINLVPEWAPTTYAEYWRIYIDANQDGDFNDADEVVFDSGAASESAVSGTLTVPASAIEGNTKMRVQMKWAEQPTECETIQYGEVEDYCVNITNATGGNECNASATVSGLTSVPNATGNGATISWTPLVGANLYQVKGRVAGSGGFATLVTANTTKTVGGLNPGTTYEWQVRARCTDNTISDFSLFDNFTTNNPRLSGTDMSLEIYPNPASDQAVISINSLIEEELTIAMTDVIGRQVSKQAATIATGMNEFVLDVKDLVDGIYLVNVIKTDGSLLFTEKILVNH